MVDHSLLYEELSQFAMSLTDNFDVDEALQRLNVTAVAALAVDGAGVTLWMPPGEAHYVSASDPATIEVERQQDRLQQGPCVDAIRGDEVVTAAEPDVETRWPGLGSVLLATGFRSAAGVPIRFHGEVIGALDLYRCAGQGWTTDEKKAGQMVADMAAGYLVAGHLHRTAEALAHQLGEALESRIVIEQAKGKLAERHGISPDAAFQLMRAYVRSQRVKLRDFAQMVVEGTGEVPAP